MSELFLITRCKTRSLAYCLSVASEKRCVVSKDLQILYSHRIVTNGRHSQFQCWFYFTLGGVIVEDEKQENDIVILEKCCPNAFNSLVFRIDTHFYQDPARRKIKLLFQRSHIFIERFNCNQILEALGNREDPHKLCYYKQFRSVFINITYQTQ